MYESPINLVENVTKSLVEQIDDDLILTIQREIGWNIDKEELLRALHYDRDQYFKGYHDGRLADEWIPVSKRLPKPGELDGDVDKYYLVQNEHGDMMVARYTHSEYWEQIFQTTPIADEIVAWMPLPEEYVADSEVKE